MHRGGSRPEALYLFDADPDLARDIPAGEYEEARRRAVARIVEIDGPRWDPAALAAQVAPGWRGLYLADGLLVRRVAVAQRVSCELLGPGDIFRPWDEDGDHEPLAVTVDWLVLRPTRVGVLDAPFALRVARWPSINAAMMARVAARARHLAIAAAVTHLPRTYARILLMFSLLAERWGTVTLDGIVIRLPLTHEVLGMVVGSHRPTVTIALQRLGREGLIIRQASDRWLLTGKALERLEAGRLDQTIRIESD